MSDLLADSIKRLIYVTPDGLSARFSIQPFTDNFAMPFW
jgi:hypothetical protein